MTNQYDDIIHLPHHVSATRPQMPMSDRAAQFAPFAALRGHDAAIKETARLTEGRLDLAEDEKASLDQRLAQLLQSGTNIALAITYYVADLRKAGGAYRSITGQLKRLDEHERLILLTDGTAIPFDDVVELEVGHEKRNPI